MYNICAMNGSIIFFYINIKKKLIKIMFLITYFKFGWKSTLISK